MRADAKTAPHKPSQPPEKMSFLARSWRAVKDFTKGAVYALPMTLLTSGAALGLSVLANHTLGVDPLGVNGKFLMRWLGTGAIFAVVGGGVKAGQGWDNPADGTPQHETAPKQQKQQQVAMGHVQSYDSITPGFTPPVEREARVRT